MRKHGRRALKAARHEAAVAGLSPVRQSGPARVCAGPPQAGQLGMQGTAFGLTEAELAHLGMTWGVGGLIVLMLFIIWSVARESKAGRMGSFVLFFVLAFGIFGFVMKQLIQWVLGIG